jgi:hypothetical protein
MSDIQISGFDMPPEFFIRPFASDRFSTGLLTTEHFLKVL